MTAVSKNVYIPEPDEIVNKYNSTYKTIKMKLSDVKVDTFINFDVEKNDKDPEFKIGDHMWILKYKNIFAKGCIWLIWRSFCDLNVKSIVTWMYVIEHLKGEEVARTFYEKEFQNKEIKQSLG